MGLKWDKRKERLKLSYQIFNWELDLNIIKSFYSFQLFYLKLYFWFLLSLPKELKSTNRFSLICFQILVTFCLFVCELTCQFLNLEENLFFIKLLECTIQSDKVLLLNRYHQISTSLPWFPFPPIFSHIFKSLDLPSSISLPITKSNQL